MNFIYRNGARTIDQMSSLPLPFRELLKSKAEIGYGTIRTSQLSIDGTRKFLFDLSAGSKPAQIESVLIPAVASRRPYGKASSSVAEEDDRESNESAPGTLCISSEAGCSLNCAFCHTGTQPLQRKLLPHEIVSQVLDVMHSVGDFPLTANRPRSVTNIVFMGQGEPLLNFRNVSAALTTLLAQNIITSPSRIVVSTSGIPKMIPALADFGVGLALSLHAPDNALRNQLVPINKVYPLETVLEACREYLKKVDARTGSVKRKPRMTLEYVMLAGVNDSVEMAEGVAKIALKQLDGRAKVNLLPFNPWKGSSFETSSDEAIQRFAEVLRTRNHVQVNVRTPRGRDIMAACGQLKTSMDSKRGVRGMEAGAGDELRSS
jgi:23S rRNA (adenine2503-C2)-methyltransferase